MKSLYEKPYLKVCMSILFLSVFLISLAEPLSAAQQKSCGPPPPAKPRTRSGGESMAPLPLPVTPLRRTEQKRMPSPPALVGKVVYGKPYVVQQGAQSVVYYDSTTDPADMINLLNWTRNQMGIGYRMIEIYLDRFSYDPDEIPIMYISGHEGFVFTPEQRERIRRYLFDGGYLLADACCGSTEFTGSFVDEMKKIFPQRPLELLSSDHPVLKAFYQINKVKYQVEGKGESIRAPYLMGINLSCRTAVFFSPYDMSCGWDGHVHEAGSRVLPEFARQLGANLITYALANYQLGRFLSTETVYYQKDEKTRDEFVFGQIIHQGDWDPDPQAVSNLLKYVKSNSTMNVQFRREEVDLRRLEAFKYSFLYMTGHRDFVFGEDEVQCLRSYLLNGGVLLADACCGRDEFDTAFRREIRRILPEFDLKPIGLSSRIYTMVMNVRTVTYTPLLQQEQPGLKTPALEGIDLAGVTGVVYSRYDLGCGWEMMEHPYSRGYESRDALRLGLNILMYAETH